MDKFGDYSGNEANKDEPKYVHCILLIIAQRNMLAADRFHQ
jgi:hypothetical protein